jgi:hypothetical protein
MKFFLSLFKRLRQQPPHDDNLRPDSGDSTVSGYAVMCKAH